MLEAQHVLRLGLIFLGVHVRRNEAHRRDPVAAHGLGQAAQVGRGGHDLEAVLRKSRRCQGKQRGDESGTQHHGLQTGKDRAVAALP